MDVPLPITGDPAADRLLAEDPFALLLGMLLDQQITMELAFTGPHRLRQRVADASPAGLAAMAEDDVVEAFCTPPALHRYCAAMARRAHALAQHLVAEHGGDAAAVWRDVPDGAAVLRRLRALPGFGPEKAKIMLAILGKRFGVQPEGWEAAAAPFSDDVPRSAADVGSAADLARVREWKRAQRAAGRSKQD